VLRRRYRTIHVAVLDRQMAESIAILRAVDAGYRSPRVAGCERTSDEHNNAVWAVTLGVWRRSKPTPR
jgi:hypothetical protein